ncbi:hypothetical protein [Stenotrophomonas sp. GD03657]|uniref:hypothetical protein n=1 Tax=Stenotrophomonas sp. GD03657 TaxID=2975363 RepID=UPI00244876B5|nr:hypothetical protein [Stenotrophomonas sp. GD03657]MDH2154222.1 hypothetical protein [Stenotrophomonas sp. GD03657]
MSVVKQHLRSGIQGSLGNPSALNSALKLALTNEGGTLSDRARANSVVAGLESLGETELGVASTGLAQNRSWLVNKLKDSATASVEQIENTFGPGLEAATVILAASGNLSAYADAAIRSQAQGDNVVQTAGQGSQGSMMFGEPTAALEAFDETPLKEMLDYSVSWNLHAARQDAFGEAHFRTIVVTPELGGIDITVPLVRVFDKADHNNDGKRYDVKMRNLVDAYVDPTVLADESTKVVPAFLGADNEAAFVPAAAVAVRNVLVAGVPVPTAPLLIGEEHDLLGLSAYEPLLGMNALDINDALDKGAKISNLYVQTAAGKAAIKFSTGSIMRNAFVKSPEGNYRELILSFNTMLRLDKDTKAVDGTAVTELAALVSGGYTAVFEVKVKGDMNVELGNTSVTAMGLKLRSLKDEDGNEVDTSSGTGATIKAAVEASKVIGYDIDARRTNSNRRTVGIRLNNTLQTNRYHIPVGAPISIQAPHASNTDAADLKALIATTRVRNSNNAVTALLNTADFLEEHFIPGLDDAEIVSLFPGMGRYLIKPYFEKHTLDIEKAINSIKSHEKAEDIAAVFVQAIRDIAIRLIQRSRYQAALDVLTGGTGTMPTLVVGTDQVISRYLIVPGDTRTFGETFQSSKIVVTQDQRMFGKIILTLTREDQDGPDPLSFGNHLWIPELVTTVANVTRGNQQIKETQVQPRTLHMVNCAVMGVIDVVNLHKVVTDKIATPALATDISNPYLEGHTYVPPAP